jgi:hypothetical protein
VRKSLRQKKEEGIDQSIEKKIFLRREIKSGTAAKTRPGHSVQNQIWAQRPLGVGTRRSDEQITIQNAS